MGAGVKNDVKKDVVRKLRFRNPVGTTPLIILLAPFQLFVTTL